TQGHDWRAAILTRAPGPAHGWGRCTPAGTGVTPIEGNFTRRDEAGPVLRRARADCSRRDRRSYGLLLADERARASRSAHAAGGLARSRTAGVPADHTSLEPPGLRRRARAARWSDGDRWPRRSGRDVDGARRRKGRRVRHRRCAW